MRLQSIGSRKTIVVQDVSAKYSIALAAPLFERRWGVSLWRRRLPCRASGELGVQILGPPRQAARVAPADLRDAVCN